jgi:hypothetical protein
LDLGASVLLVVAQKSVYFDCRNATEPFLKFKVNSPPVIGLYTFLGRPTHSSHKLGKFGCFERHFFCPVEVSSNLIV